MMPIITSQATHQLSMLFRGSFGWMKVKSIATAVSTACWPLSQTCYCHWPELGLARPHRSKSANAKASQPGSLHCTWFCSSFAGCLTQAQRALPLSFTDRCKQLSALPAAIHQHNETLPYWSIPHRQLNLSQRHFSSAVRQLHSQSF